MGILSSLHKMTYFLLERGGGSMDCEKVQDWFSSFWEKELSPSEEKALKEHLSSCPRCQKEFEQFAKTMRWLQSAEEVEVPEEFLSEIHKKLEEKKRAVPWEKVGGRRFHFPMSFKLPAQAVAMVAVVFFVLYLTKMIPTEGVRLQKTKATPSPLSLEEKPEGISTRSATSPRPELMSKVSPSSEGEVEKRHPESTLSEPSPSIRQSHRPDESRGAGREVEELAQKEGKDERSALGTTRETPRSKDAEQARASVPKERLSEEVPVPQTKTEAKKSEVPARSPDAFGYQVVDSKKAASVPSPEPGETERALASREKSLVASKPPQEITLRTADRKKVVPLLHELVKQFKGEVVTTQGDILLVSLPTGSFPEFKKELAGISSSSKTDLSSANKKATGSLSFEEGMKRKERDGKGKRPAKLAADTESRTVVRILLVEE
jgi:hypothetical protein